MKKILAALAIACAIAAPARAADPVAIPDFDFKAYCLSSAIREALEYSIKDEQAIRERKLNCIAMQQWQHEELVRLWPRLTDDSRKYCLDGAKEYGEVVNCAKIKQGKTPLDYLR